MLRIVAPFFDISTYGEASRRFVAPLISAGAKLKLEVMGLTSIKVHGDELTASIKRLSTTQGEVDKTLCILPALEMAEYSRKLGTKVDHYFIPALQHIPDIEGAILETYTNLVMLPPRWSGVLDNEDILQIPVDRKEFETSTVKAKLGNSNIGTIKPITDKTYLFYTQGKWEEQNNFRDLLEAYWLQFSGSDDVCLVIKTHLGGVNPGLTDAGPICKDLEHLKKSLGLSNPASVLLLCDVWPRKYMVGLMKRVDCYVSLRHWDSANWDVIDATACGTPTIGLDGVQGQLVDSRILSVQRPVLGLPGVDPKKNAWEQPDLWLSMAEMAWRFSEGRLPKEPTTSWSGLFDPKSLLEYARPYLGQKV